MVEGVRNYMKKMGLQEHIALNRSEWRKILFVEDHEDKFLVHATNLIYWD